MTVGRARTTTGCSTQQWWPSSPGASLLGAGLAGRLAAGDLCDRGVVFDGADVLDDRVVARAARGAFDDGRVTVKVIAWRDTPGSRRPLRRAPRGPPAVRRVGLHGRRPAVAARPRGVASTVASSAATTTAGPSAASTTARDDVELDGMGPAFGNGAWTDGMLAGLRRLRRRVRRAGVRQRLGCPPGQAARRLRPLPRRPRRHGLERRRGRPGLGARRARRPRRGRRCRRGAPRAYDAASRHARRPGPSLGTATSDDGAGVVRARREQRADRRPRRRRCRRSATRSPTRSGPSHAQAVAVRDAATGTYLRLSEAAHRLRHRRRWTPTRRSARPTTSTRRPVALREAQAGDGRGRGAALRLRHAARTSCRPGSPRCAPRRPWCPG